VRYTVASAINLAILIVGIALGVVAAPHFSGTAKANAIQAQSPSKPPPSPPIQLPNIHTQDASVDYVTPAITLGGPVVTNTLLANRIACDRLEVNGFEPLRISDAMLSLLVSKGIITSAEVNDVISKGKAPKPLRLRTAQ